MKIAISVITVITIHENYSLTFYHLKKIVLFKLLNVLFWIIYIVTLSQSTDKIFWKHLSLVLDCLIFIKFIKSTMYFSVILSTTFWCFIHPKTVGFDLYSTALKKKNLWKGLMNLKFIWPYKILFDPFP